MLRYTAEWSIPNAGPSLTTFHFAGTLGVTLPQPVANAVAEFFDGIKSVLPDEVTIGFPGQLEEIDPANGQLTGVLPVSPGVVVTGTGTGPWSAGSGGRIDWLTGTYLNGRQVKGRTFIVPLVGAVYDTSGRVATGTVTGLTAAAAGLLADANTNGSPLVVWHRPTEQAPGSGRQIQVVQGVGQSMPATLRGRKY